MTYTVTMNAEYGSLEIRFESKPTPAVLSALKTRRFRWHHLGRYWYGKGDENALREELDKLTARAEKIAAANRQRSDRGPVAPTPKTGLVHAPATWLKVVSEPAENDSRFESFCALYGDLYSRLYGNNNEIPGRDYNAAVDVFGSRSASENGDPDFRGILMRFIDFRRDYITSDREAAAFAMAYHDVYETTDPAPDPDGKPETPAFPKREEIKPLAFSYRIGGSYGQANFTPELLENAPASTLKIIYPMIDGIENADERKHAWFTLAALAWYKAAENPEKRPAFRTAADLYREKTGEDFPTPAADESGKPAASKTVTAACKRIYGSLDKTNCLHGILTDGETRIATDGNHAVYLRSAAPDLPAAKEDGKRFSEYLRNFESLPRAEALPLPTVRELKAWIKTRRVKDKKKLAYNLDGIMVNPAYLLNLLEALPGCIAYRPEHKITAIVFASGEDRGILMPLRPGTAESAA